MDELVIAEVEATALQNLGRASKLAKLRTKQRGAEIIEMALALPVFPILIIGGIDFATMLYDKTVITNAAREGARAGVVVPVATPNKSGASVARTVACKFISTYLISYNTSSTKPAGSVCTNSSAYVDIVDAASPYAMGQPLAVTVNYQYAGLGILGSLLSDFSLSATTTMLYE